jgi:transcriptional adapter 3
MRIRRLISQLLETVGAYIPFVGSSAPPANSPVPVKMKHKKSSNSASAASPPKGKGKGKEKSGSGETIDLKDLPLRLPEFANGDHVNIVPRYSSGDYSQIKTNVHAMGIIVIFFSVLKRSESDGIGMEDIDTLQLELEALLSSTVVRKMSLREECKVLNEAEKYKGQGKFNKNSSPGKRGLNGGKDGRSAKKLKSSMIGKPSNDSGKIIGMPRIKADNSGPAFDPLQNEQIRALPESAKPLLPKNETPNRFWAFVEPYCAPIAQDDIKLLEDLIKSHSDMSEYHRAPKLGQHYTQRWAKEDLENERLKSAGDPNAAMDGKGADEAALLLKKAEGPSNDDSPFGELTQRLVAGLMEENVLNPVDESTDTAKKGSGGDSSDTENVAAKGQLIKSLNITNAENLEARVRKELEEQGILNPNEEDKDDMENDEILEELGRCQNELKAVSSHNLQQLKRLLKAAKEEIARQELRNKLQQADNDVMDAYRKISTARSKKKPPTKKERDYAWKTLKEREIILKQLESI